MTYESENETQPSECTLDPSVLQLIQELAQALQSHHIDCTASDDPLVFARALYRDRELVDEARDFLAMAQGRPQSWHIPEIF